MNNSISQDEKFLTQTQAALPKTWSKPQLTATPLESALSGNASKQDGLTSFSGS